MARFERGGGKGHTIIYCIANEDAISITVGFYLPLQNEVLVNQLSTRDALSANSIRDESESIIAW